MTYVDVLEVISVVLIVLTIGFNVIDRILEKRLKHRLMIAEITELEEQVEEQERLFKLMS